VHNFIPRGFQLALLLGSAEATEAAAKEGKACCWKTFFFHYSTVLYHSCICLLSLVLFLSGWRSCIHVNAAERRMTPLLFACETNLRCIFFRFLSYRLSLLVDPFFIA
jgi:hypothetical protein